MAAPNFYRSGRHQARPVAIPSVSSYGPVSSSSVSSSSTANLSAFQLRLREESKHINNDVSSAGAFSRQRLASTTVKSYRNGVIRYESYCLSNNYVSWPITDEVLRQWVSNMAIVGKLVSGTINNYIYGVIHEANEKDMFMNNYTYRQFPKLMRVMQGIRKNDNHVVMTRSPLTIPLLAKLLTHLNSSINHDAMLMAVLTAGVNGLLRAGEIANDTKEGVCPLVQRDITMHVTYYDLLLRTSKTDRFGDGVVVR